MVWALAAYLGKPAKPPGSAPVLVLGGNSLQVRHVSNLPSWKVQCMAYGASFACVPFEPRAARCCAASAATAVARGPLLPPGSSLATHPQSCQACLTAGQAGAGQPDSEGAHADRPPAVQSAQQLLETCGRMQNPAAVLGAEGCSSAGLSEPVWSSKLGSTSTISSSSAGLLLSRATASWHRWQVVTAAGACSQQLQPSIWDGIADACRHFGQSTHWFRQCRQGAAKHSQGVLRHAVQVQCRDRPATRDRCRRTAPEYRSCLSKSTISSCWRAGSNTTNTWRHGAGLSMNVVHRTYEQHKQPARTWSPAGKSAGRLPDTGSSISVCGISDLKEAHHKVLLSPLGPEGLPSSCSCQRRSQF